MANRFSTVRGCFYTLCENEVESRQSPWLSRNLLAWNMSGIASTKHKMPEVSPIHDAQRKSPGLVDRRELLSAMENLMVESSYNADNLFARILRKDAPCFTVFEDDIALAFMDLFPQSEGHTLVIPKDVFVPDFVKMPPCRIGSFMERVHLIARALVAAFEPDGLCIMQLNGHAAGQTIFHPHFHLIPRWTQRAFYNHGEAPSVSLDALQAQATMIRGALIKLE